jgi:hypothetical protein
MITVPYNPVAILPYSPTIRPERKMEEKGKRWRREKKRSIE